MVTSAAGISAGGVGCLEGVVIEARSVAAGISAVGVGCLEYKEVVVTEARCVVPVISTGGVGWSEVGEGKGEGTKQCIKVTDAGGTSRAFATRNFDETLNYGRFYLFAYSLPVNFVVINLPGLLVVSYV